MQHGPDGVVDLREGSARAAEQQAMAEAVPPAVTITVVS